MDWQLSEDLQATVRQDQGALHHTSCLINYERDNNMQNMVTMVIRSYFLSSSINIHHNTLMDLTLGNTKRYIYYA